jgi:hypothetical protein
MGSIGEIIDWMLNISIPIQIPSYNALIGQLVQVLDALHVLGRDLTAENSPADLPILRAQIVKSMKGISFFQSFPNKVKAVYEGVKTEVSRPYFWPAIFCIGEGLLTLFWFVSFLILSASRFTQSLVVLTFMCLSLIGFRNYFYRLVDWIVEVIEQIKIQVSGVEKIIEDYQEYCTSRK